MWLNFDLTALRFDLLETKSFREKTFSFVEIVEQCHTDLAGPRIQRTKFHLCKKTTQLYKENIQTLLLIKTGCLNLKRPFCYNLKENSDEKIKLTPLKNKQRENEDQWI